MNGDDCNNSEAGDMNAFVDDDNGDYKISDDVNSDSNNKEDGDSGSVNDEDSSNNEADDMGARADDDSDDYIFTLGNVFPSMNSYRATVFISQQRHLPT